MALTWQGKGLSWRWPQPVWLQQSGQGGKKNSVRQPELSCWTLLFPFAFFWDCIQLKLPTIDEQNNFKVCLWTNLLRTYLGIFSMFIIKQVLVNRQLATIMFPFLCHMMHRSWKAPAPPPHHIHTQFCVCLIEMVCTFLALDREWCGSFKQKAAQGIWAPLSSAGS